ncbi:alpha/beta hydrolase fold-domain-containing protein, partial [Baffinella frigidus]
YVARTEIEARLVSCRAFQGQEGADAIGGGKPLLWSKTAAAPSRMLIVHFHGGGFIAQSSASHELYLRDWARALDCPILSVDYDLAPDHPFPVAGQQSFFAFCWVAVQQSFFAFCWALKNAARLEKTK